MVRTVENFPPFNQLNISLADIPCVLENDFGEAVQSTQPVTLYITVNITPPNLPLGIPTEDDISPAEDGTILGPIQFTAPGHLFPVSHHQPAETGNTMPQILEETSATITENAPLSLHRADEAMKQILPTGRSNTWERAVGRFKWVMDTLSPIAEVRVMPFDVLG